MQKKKKKDNAFLLLSSYAPAFSFNIEVPQWFHEKADVFIISIMC
jgi:hypothetical protein